MDSNNNSEYVFVLIEQFCHLNMYIKCDIHLQFFYYKISIILVLLLCYSIFRFQWEVSSLNGYRFPQLNNSDWILLLIQHICNLGRISSWYIVSSVVIALSPFSGVRVTRSLVLCVCFVYRCLSFCPLSFGHYVASPSSIYWFWLPFWYLQALLIIMYSPNL